MEIRIYDILLQHINLNSHHLSDRRSPHHVQPCHYNFCTKNYWVLRLFPSSGVLGSRNTTFRKLDLFRASGEGKEKTPTELGTLERANFNLKSTSAQVFTLLCRHVEHPESHRESKSLQNLCFLIHIVLRSCVSLHLTSLHPTE
jgi:hypothetical protein